MGRSRFISPYFSAVGVRESAVLLKGVFLAALPGKKKNRQKLHSLIADRFGSASAFSYTSARGALASFLSAIGIEKDQEVLLSAFTCLAVPSAVIAAGGKPVYCDIEAQSLNVTRDSIKAAITPQTRVIVIQHTLGSVAPVEAIVALAKEHGIITVEDCALAIASKKNNREVGTTADAAIFSMELSKTLSIGWGGILLVNDPQLAVKISEKYKHTGHISFLKTGRMALQTMVTGICYQPSFFQVGKYVVAAGFKTGIFKVSTPEPEHHGQITPDFTSVLSSPQVVLAIHQWKRLNNVAHICEQNAVVISKVVNKLGYTILGVSGPAYNNVTPRISFLVADRPAAMDFFLSNNIEAGSWFDGPLQPLPAESIYNYQRIDYPSAVFVADHIVNIPCHYRINADDLAHIIETMKQYAAAYKGDMDIQEKLKRIGSASITETT